MRRVLLLLSFALLACLPAHSQSNQASEAALQRWTLRHTLMGHTVSVHAVAFSPDGRTLASASWDRSIILWDVLTGAKKLILKHGYHPHQLTFSPDGRFLYSSGGDGTIKKWDMQTGKARAIIYGRNEILNLSLSEDGSILACDCRARAAEVLDAQTGALRFTAPHGDYVWAVALSPDSKWLAVAGSNKRLPVELWDVQSAQLARKFTGVKNAGAVAFSPDSNILAVASQEDENIKLFNTQTGELSQTLSKDGSRFSRLVFSPDGSLLAVMPDLSGWVYVYDLREKRWTGAIQTDGSIRDIAFSADGKMLATAGYDDKTVRIWSNPTPEN